MAGLPTAWARVRREPALALALGAFALALVLGSIGVAEASLWLDETFSVFDARRSLADIFAMRGEAFGGAHHPPGYFVLLKATIAVCGVAEPCVRAPSIVGNAVLAAVLVLLGARSFGTVAGATAGLSWAAMPYAIKYAQQARQYGLLALMAALALLLAVQALQLGRAAPARPPRRRTFVALGLVAAAALWLHLFALPFLGALALWCAAWHVVQRRHGRAPSPRAWLLCVAVAVLASAPLLPGLARVWLTDGGGQLASRAGPVENARELIIDLWSFGLDTPHVVLLAALSCLPGPWSRRGLALGLAALAVLPMTVVFVRNPEHFVTLRYFMMSLVPIAVLLGAGVAAAFELAERARTRWLPRLPRWSAALVAAIAIAPSAVAIERLAVPALRKQYATAGYEPWRGVADAIAAEAQPGDVTIVVPHALVRFPFEVYPLPTVVLDGASPTLLDELARLAPARVFVVSSHIDRPERVAARRQALRTLARAGYVRRDPANSPRQPAIELLGYIARQ